MLAASIIRALITLVLEAASTFETSVNFYQTTRHNNPEASHLKRSEQSLTLYQRVMYFQ
jgi:hypothetical protein